MFVELFSLLPIRANQDPALTIDAYIRATQDLAVPWISKALHTLAREVERKTAPTAAEVRAYAVRAIKGQAEREPRPKELGVSAEERARNWRMIEAIVERLAEKKKVRDGRLAAAGDAE